MSAAHDPGGKRKPRWPADSKVEARFSKCTRYRYTLEEIWDTKLPQVMWLLMNPSVAGLDHADPTLRRTGEFSRRWGYGGQLVGNVHAYRVTAQRRLLEIDDAAGPGNDEALVSMARRTGVVMLAYGQPPKPLRSRSAAVVELLRATGAQLYSLRLAKDGSPYHPLYLPADTLPVPF